MIKDVFVLMAVIYNDMRDCVLWPFYDGFCPQSPYVIILSHIISEKYGLIAG